MGVWAAIAAARQNRTVCLVEKYAEGHAQGLVARRQPHLPLRVFDGIC